MSFVQQLVPRLPGVSAPGRIPGLRLHVDVTQFFDRGTVMAAVSAGKRKALIRAALRVQSYARKSIKKKGDARRPLAMQVRIGELYNLNRPYPLGEIYRSRGGLTPRELATVTARFMESASKRNLGSQPGTPPHTHVPPSHALGFRNNIFFGFDALRGSVVVGPRALGYDPFIGALHEYGGVREMVLYSLVSRGRPVPVYQWFSVFARPRPSMWRHSGVTKRAVFPARPFMRPALDRAVAAGDLARAFSRVVTASGSSTAALAPR